MDLEFDGGMDLEFGDLLDTVLDHNNGKKMEPEVVPDNEKMETEGSIFGFKVADIITCVCGNCTWDDKYVLVRGFDFKEKRVYGLVCEEIGGVLQFDYEKPVGKSCHSQKLELVRYAPHNIPTVYTNDPYAKEKELPPLQIGDRVIGVSDVVTGYCGEVIAIGPPELLNRYVVEFNHCKTGESLLDLFGMLWYPVEKRVDSRARFCCMRGDIRHLDQTKQTKVVKKEKETPLPIKIQEFYDWYKEKILSKDPPYPLVNCAKTKELTSAADFNQLLGKDKGDLREAVKTLGMFFYELISGASERNNPSYVFDGYPPLSNRDFPQNFLKIIYKMANGKIFSKNQL